MSETDVVTAASEVTTVRAKFVCTSIKSVNWSPTLKVYGFSAVGDDGIPENKRYHKYTPSGTIELSVDNPAVDGFYELGKSYYLDFTPVPAS